MKVELAGVRAAEIDRGKRVAAILKSIRRAIARRRTLGGEDSVEVKVYGDL